MIQTLVALLIFLEGFSPTPYRDGHGCSIGYGMHSKHCVERVSRTNARLQLVVQATEISQFVQDEAYPTILTEQQIIALSSFVYNVGYTGYHNSKLCKDVRAGRFLVAAEDFKMWNKPSSVKKRRRIERYYFLTGHIL